MLDVHDRVYIYFRGWRIYGRNNNNNATKIFRVRTGPLMDRTIGDTFKHTRVYKRTRALNY